MTDPVELKVSGPDAAKLIAELLASGAEVRFAVAGRSMAPFLRGGEIVTVRASPAGDLRVGDLVLFRDATGYPRVHRLVARRPKLLAKGDAMLRPDEPVAESDVLGRVRRIESAGRVRDLDAVGWRIVAPGLAVVNLARSALRRAWGRLRGTAELPAEEPARAVPPKG